MTSICRLCLCTIPSSSIVPVYKDNIPQEDKIEHLIPEIDLNVTTTLDLCNLCTHLLSAAYSFKQGCLKTEETIREYIAQNSDTPVDLHSVKQFRRMHTSLIEDDNSPTNLHITTSLNRDVLSLKDDIKIEMHDVEMKKPLDVTVICCKCNGTFENEELFKKHREECLYYKCNKCGKIVLTKDGYNRHYKSHLALKTCTICNRTFRRPYQLRAHNIRYHAKKPIICDKCDFACSSKDELQKHKLSYDAEFVACSSEAELEKQLSSDITLEESQKKSITCDKCEFSCSTREEINLHNSTHMYRCHLCTGIYFQLDDLQAHKTKAHPEGTGRECLKCNLVLRNAYLLQRHVKRWHRDPIICEICGLKCSSKVMLIEHIRTHTGERPFRCEICGKGFAQMSTLTTHKRCVHDDARPFKCNICEKSFAVRGSYTKHIRVHKSRERTFECLYEGCGRKYMSGRDLAKHAVRHGEKRYDCKFCEKTFYDGSGLKRHMMCHSGEKPYECTICHKGFTQGSNLRVHLKSHRPKVGRDKTLMVTEDKTDIEVHLPPSS